MDNRRDFLKKAGLLGGGFGLMTTLPPSIQRALSIDPPKGSTFHDAEHIVFLMQENRSFDHCFGSLQGVRGFNDPRAISLPNKIPVWLQSNKTGDTYVPFRLHIKDTKATWMGDLPHSWENQVDARNHGKYDQWLEAKRPWNKEYAHIPLTMGYYTREDIPFYYSLADSFTVFDQHFCSSLTGTTSNRLFFWSGKLRDSPSSPPLVRNSEVSYNKEVHWKTFPERLEEHGIPWKVYQNEISLKTELSGEDESLLANFTDNNLEWFSQFNVRYSEGHRKYLEQRKKVLPEEILALEQQLSQEPNDSDSETKKVLVKKRRELLKTKETLQRWSMENFDKLSDYEKNLHQRAFTTNSKDPNYHQTETISYTENGEERSVKIPKGDILHQFREDVNKDQLPTVSWLVAPQKFSDHPSAPWYGAWYVSEVLDILTKNPEIWKKTIFILTYDENDGYFDHVPPFVAPRPDQKSAVSKGIDTAEEYVALEEELDKKGLSPKNARESPVGLGYRVPMVIASPWSKGGWVNSEVCDISSTLMFMEEFLSKKTGKHIKETNISDWRRTVCGNLTSSFRTFDGEGTKLPEFIERNEIMKTVYNASFKDLPSNFKALTADEIQEAVQNPRTRFMPRQEPGIRDSSPLSYELYVDGRLTGDRKYVEISFTAADKFFGNAALGAPFNVYAPGNYLQKNKEGEMQFEAVQTWSQAVRAGDSISSQWPLEHFEDKRYHLRVYGPNGFYRELKGDQQDPEIAIELQYQRNRGFIKKPNGNIEIQVTNSESNRSLRLKMIGNAYNTPGQDVTIVAGETKSIIVETKNSYGWYDFTLQVEGDKEFERRYAGRVETGRPSKSDPLMGEVNV
ncbi:phospholipase C [Arenibacter nanhaiticus]|uniref:phospholipase C n=1 Tax=Arenibacter nanhaiticus TaxID=558155 RepID=A0A1M6LEK8_9FLAO|nr:phospholipase C, phosphocholine-specific [Arenibacter nanhaiticus]SHJ69650.1 phospholipase C [Arenibacter nanhaiticus]